MTNNGLCSALTGRRTAVSVVVVIVLLASACASPTATPLGSSPTPSSSPVAVTHTTPGSSPSASTASPSPVDGAFTLGHFPAAPTGSLPDTTTRALQAALDAAIDQGLPGITATALVAGRGVWSGAAGIADGVHPVVVRSQFAIASITKTVIAAEVMWLSEQGKLRLSDPVSKHLPSSFHFDTNGATIENLLSMESGIPDPALSVSDIAADPQREWTAQEVLASVPAIRSTPGDHFVYEDANYMLLGLVIAETTGMSVAAAVRTHVLADPRLASMVYQVEERPKGPLALPFGSQRDPKIDKVGGAYLPTKAEASGPSGSGGMASDSGALALWGYLLVGGQILSERSLLAMTDFGSGASYDRYGLGVFDQTNLGAGFEVQSVGNGGWDVGGYSSALAVLPSGGIVISVMTNTAGDPVDLVFPVAQKLASSLQP
jgi:D-alanyl-D-alanine carboxypeptidase